MTSELKTHFSINSLDSAKNIYDILLIENVPPLEALNLIDSRIILVQENCDFTSYKCSKCNNTHTINGDPSINEANREALDWFFHHKCKGKILNLRK